MLQELSDQIADSFVMARRSGRALATYPGKIPETLFAAYHVQNAAIVRYGEKIIGWKVGRIFPPLSAQFGAERLAGPIFENAVQTAQDAVGLVFDGGFAAAEAEFLLRIGETPQSGKRQFTLDEAAALIDRVHVGIEIASSPLASINDLGPPVIISDFGNNNGLIVGNEIPDWRVSGFESWTVTTRIDGAAVGSGAASAFPDGPIGSARFLLELMAERGITLPARSWISTGAVSGVHKVCAGQQVEARFGDDYAVCCAIEAAPKR